MRLRETTGDSWDSKRLAGTHETQRDYWGLMRLKETNGDSWDSERQMGTHETQRDYWRLRETDGDSQDSKRLMRAKRLLGTDETKRGLID